MTKRLTKEYSEHMRRVQEIEDAVMKAIPQGSIKLEVFKALNNVTLDLLNDWVTGTYRTYEDD